MLMRKRAVSAAVVVSRIAAGQAHSLAVTSSGRGFRQVDIISIGSSLSLPGFACPAKPVAGKSKPAVVSLELSDGFQPGSSYAPTLLLETGSAPAERARSCRWCR